MHFHCLWDALTKVICTSLDLKFIGWSRMSYNPEKPLISGHFPKCAGTSFNRVLRKWFGRKLLRHYVDEKTGRMPKRYSLYGGMFTKRPKVGLCIHGHFNRERGTGVDAYYPGND